MQKKRVLSLILALSCTAALLGGCAGSDTSDDNAASGEHEVITMNAPYCNMSQFYDLVHEKYPEINLEIIPYNMENTSSYAPASPQSPAGREFDTACGYDLQKQGTGRRDTLFSPRRGT